MTFDEAKEAAENEALQQIGQFRENENQQLLEENYLEEANCWMFFRNQNINIPEECSLRKFAYVFSTKGTGRLVGDYYNNLNQAQEYLKKMSAYFKERNL